MKTAWEKIKELDTQATILFAKNGETNKFVLLAPEGDDFFKPVTNYYNGLETRQYLVRVLNLGDNSVSGLVLPKYALLQLYDMNLQVHNLGEQNTKEIIMTKTTGEQIDLSLGNDICIDDETWCNALQVSFHQLTEMFTRIIAKNKPVQTFTF